VANADVPLGVDAQQLFGSEQALVMSGGRNPYLIGCDPHTHIALCTHKEAALIETLTDSNDVMTDGIAMG
jgi:hypothetical protein